GGRNNTSVLPPDVWRLRNPGGGWQWNLLTTTGSAPVARYLHSAIYDDKSRDRMLVLGGASTIGGQATDADVWELKFTANDPEAPAQWTKLTLLPNSPAPNPRRGHSLVFQNDFSTDRPGKTGQWNRAILFGGKDQNGVLRDSLWILWISAGTQGQI